MSLFKKFTPLSAVITALYLAWLIWFFAQSQTYFTFEEYAYGITFSALFACFFFAVQGSNKNFLAKLVLVLAPYLVWIYWLITNNVDQVNPDLFPILLVSGILAFIAACFIMTSSFNSVDKQLLATGERAPAKILAIEDTNLTINGTLIAVVLTLEVQSSSKGVFTTKQRTLVSRVQIPRVGDMVTVVFDPLNPDNIAVL